MKIQILKTYSRGKEVNGKIIFLDDEVIEEKEVVNEKEIKEMCNRCVELRVQYGSKDKRSWKYQYIGEDEDGEYTFITRYVR